MFAINKYKSIKFFLIIFGAIFTQNVYSQFDGSIALAYGVVEHEPHKERFTANSLTSSDGSNASSSSDLSYSSSSSEEILDKEMFDRKVSKLKRSQAKLSHPRFKLPNGNTLLHYAIINEYCEQAINLISHAYYLNRDVDPVNNDNETPLHLAICAKNLNVPLIGLLIDCGANILKQNNNYANSLDLLKKHHSSQEKGFKEVSALLGTHLSRTARSLAKDIEGLASSNQQHTDAMKVRISREQEFNQELNGLVEAIKVLYDRDKTRNESINDLKRTLNEKNNAEKKLKLFIAGASLGLSIKWVYAYQRKIKKKLHASYIKFKEKYEQLAAEAQLFWHTL